MPIDVSSSLFPISDQHLGNSVLKAPATPGGSPLDPTVAELAQLTVAIDHRGWLILIGFDQFTVVNSLAVRSLVAGELQAETQKAADRNVSKETSIKEVVLCEPK